MNFPAWLELLAVVALALGGCCAVIILLDLLGGHSQPMWIMNLVWPTTALYLGPLALFGHELPKQSAVFWFMMQLAMAFGFLASLPINRLLLQRGIKESM